jgi:hypothetical protein
MRYAGRRQERVLMGLRGVRFPLVPPLNLDAVRINANEIIGLQIPDWMSTPSLRSDAQLPATTRPCRTGS